MTLFQLLLLYLAFRVKQYSCDFLLQSDWMAHNKGKPGIEGYRALVSHTISHGIGTTLIVLVFAPALWWLGIVDFIVHSAVDRIKGLYTWHKNWTPKDKIFWWTFGLDQEAHNLSHLAYIVIIVASLGGVLL